MTTGMAAVLCRNGIFSVRIMWTMSVCESSPSMNQPDWNRRVAVSRPVSELPCTAFQ